MTALVPVQRRNVHSERPVVIGWLALLVALCWAYLLFRAARSVPAEVGGAAAGIDLLPPPPPAPYRAAELLLSFAMWVAMASAMMLPGATRAVVLFARVNRLYHAVRRPYLATTLFVTGYLALWSGFGALATLLQWALHDAGALDTSLALTNATAAGLAFVGAGVYQWTPTKHACLHHCRTPLAFVLTGWRSGPTGALRMGAAHGAHCLGCCWLLVLLLFATGITNLWAMAALAALVLAEKVAPGGPWIATLSGLGLVAWGTLLLFP